MKKIAHIFMLLALGCFALGCSSAADTSGTPAGGTAVDTSADDGGEAVDDLDVEVEDDTDEDTP